MRRLLCLCATLLILSLTGCISTKIESTKSPGYDRTVDQLHVETRFTDGSKDMEQAMADQLRYRLQIVEIEHALHPRTITLEEGPRLEEYPIPYSSTQEGTTHILVLEEKEKDSQSTPGYWANGMYHGGSSKDKFQIDASLYDVDSEQRVWRATVGMTADNLIGSGDDQRGTDLAKEVYNKLAEDGLVPVIPNL